MKLTPSTGSVPKLQSDRHASARNISRPTCVKNGELYIINATLLPLNIHSILWRQPRFTPIYKEKENKQKKKIYHHHHHHHNSNNNNVEFVVVDTIMRLCLWRLLVRGSEHGRFSGRSKIRLRQVNNRVYLVSERRSGKRNANECWSLTEIIYK